MFFRMEDMEEWISNSIITSSVFPLLSLLISLWFRDRS